MARSIKTHVSAGTAVLYPIDFNMDFIQRDFVYVYTGSHDNYIDQLSYTWIDDTQIQLSAPEPFGTEIHIRRVIPRDAQINNYTDNAILHERNLDTSYAQALMILEEIADGFLSAEDAFTMLSDIDMQGYLIHNVGDGVVATDAINLLQAQTLVTQVFQGEHTEIAAAGSYVTDGVTTYWQTAATEYTSESVFRVTLGGLLQEPVTDYTIDTSGRLSFTAGIQPAGSRLSIFWFKPVVVQPGNGTGFVSVAMTTGTSISTIVTSVPTGGSVLVDDQIITLNGVVQEPTLDFTIASGIITIPNIPASTRVVIRSVKITS